MCIKDEYHAAAQLLRLCKRTSRTYHILTLTLDAELVGVNITGHLHPFSFLKDAFVGELCYHSPPEGDREHSS